CCQEQRALVCPRAEQTDAERCGCRAEERQRGDNADLERAQSDRRQIDRQQHGNETVAEIAQRPRGADMRGRAGASGQGLLRRIGGGGHVWRLLLLPPAPDWSATAVCASQPLAAVPG